MQVEVLPPTFLEKQACRRANEASCFGKIRNHRRLGFLPQRNFSKRTEIFHLSVNIYIIQSNVRPAVMQGYSQKRTASFARAMPSFMFCWGETPTYYFASHAVRLFGFEAAPHHPTQFRFRQLRN